MVRTYIPKRSDVWNISKERYLELQHFCLQYPNWKVEAASMLELAAVVNDGMPHSTDPGDPTRKAVERREHLVKKIELIEGCASRVDNGRWYWAIINHVCSDMTYDNIRSLHPEWLKTSHRMDFFGAKRAFFILLDREKD